MSRFSQRWRTQWNVIRNANCKTSWTIKILNAHCASQIHLGSMPVWVLATTTLWLWWILYLLWPKDYGCVCMTKLTWNVRLAIFKYMAVCTVEQWIYWVTCLVLKIHVTVVECGPSINWCTSVHSSFLISDEARLPAEFKHIIRRRKRN